jgi:muramoyltetrapeptide carboxypeptidase
MLNSLRISDSIKGVRGIVFGDFRPRGKPTENAAADTSKSFTMTQVFQNPAYCGAWFGHIRDKYTLPIGIEASMDAEKQTLTILESAVLPR